MAGPIDRHTVDQLVVTNLPAALRVAQRLVNDADAAEEVVQEALCRVLKRWPSFRGEASFSTWMMQIVVNAARDHGRRPNVAELDYDVGDKRASEPSEHFAATELQETIRRSISQLPQRQREVALLCLGEQLSTSDVAYILGTTEANVHTCLHLARKRIAQAIGINYARQT